MLIRVLKQFDHFFISVYCVSLQVKRFGNHGGKVDGNVIFEVLDDIFICIFKQYSSNVSNEIFVLINR